MARLHSPLREFPVFGSRKSRGTAEFVIQSRSRGRTLISDGWMSCVSLKGTKFEALWRGAEGARSFFLSFFFFSNLPSFTFRTKPDREEREHVRLLVGTLRRMVRSLRRMLIYAR